MSDFIGVFFAAAAGPCRHVGTAARAINLSGESFGDSADAEARPD